MSKNEFMDDKNKEKKCAVWKNWPLINRFYNPHGSVVCIRFSGVISDSTLTNKPSINYQRFHECIGKAFNTKNVKAVALVINSPGGAPAQCSLIGDQIRDLAKEKNVPVYAFVEDVAASGGYWLACAADEIYVQGSSIVGSIGVIYSGFGFQNLIQKYGVERRVHTAGENKSFMDPFLSEDKDDVARLKDMQNDIHAAFKDWVRARREKKLLAEEKDIFEAQVFSGQKAVANGLVDGVGRYENVMKDKFGKNIKFKDATPEKKWSPLSLLKSSGVPDLLGSFYERYLWSRFGI